MTDKKETPEGTGKLYELGLHIVSSLPEGEVRDVFSALKSEVEKNAKVTSEEEPNLMELAYPIKRSAAGESETFSNAYFGWIKFEASSEDIEKIKEAADSQPNVLRYIIVKTTADAEDWREKISSDEKEESEEDGETVKNETSKEKEEPLRDTPTEDSKDSEPESKEVEEVEEEK